MGSDDGDERVYRSHESVDDRVKTNAGSEENENETRKREDARVESRSGGTLSRSGRLSIGRNKREHAEQKIGERESWSPSR
jgi:hypothetical protein